MPQMNRLKTNPQLTLKQPIIYFYYIEYNNQTRSRGLTLIITNETKIFIQTCSENKRRVNLQRTSQKHFIKSIYNLPPSVTQISSCSSSLLRHVNKIKQLLNWFWFFFIFIMLTLIKLKVERWTFLSRHTLMLNIFIDLFNDQFLQDGFDWTPVSSLVCFAFPAVCWLHDVFFRTQSCRTLI